MEYSSRRGVTPKAIIIGIIVVVANTYWLVLTNEVWYGLHFTLASLFLNAVFTLFVLTLLNILLQRWSARAALNQQELLVIYIMVVMLCTLIEHSLIGYLMGILSYPIWFATPENEWQELFGRYIPQWLTVHDIDVLRGYFDGDTTFYLSKFVWGWLKPLAAWGAFILVLWWTLLCLNVLIRKPWTEQEKLSYPIIQLPLEMTMPRARLFRQRGLWVGFALAFGLDLLNGLHFFFPDLPHIELRRTQIGHYFTKKPWNAIGWTTVSFYPFVIGLTFFVPLDLSFSCWFFHLFSKSQNIAAAAIGLRGLPGAPYINEQAAGSWLALGILALWATKRHLGQMWRAVWKKSDFDAQEPMRYRTALLGTSGGIIFLCIFCYRAGMSLGIVSGFLAVYLVMAFGIARVRAEIGPPVHGMVFVNPRQILVATLGTRRIGKANLTILSFLYAFNRCNRAHPMPNQLEAFKIAERADIDRRRFIPAMVLAIIVGIIACFWLHLHVLYRYGGANRSSGIVMSLGRESFLPLQRWLRHPASTDIPATSAIGVGAVVTLLLTILRRRFIWWPFHPAGYALGSNTWGGIVYIWCAVLIGWAIKAIILRFGGLKAYRRAVPFFLGLVLGEYVMACIWSLIGVVFQIPVLRVWV